MFWLRFSHDFLLSGSFSSFPLRDTLKKRFPLKDKCYNITKGGMGIKIQGVCYLEWLLQMLEGCLYAFKWQKKSLKSQKLLQLATLS